MKGALLIAGVLMLVSAPFHADAGEASDPLALDPTVGMIDVREDPATNAEPGHPVPEPSTMAITSMGLLAAAAYRRERGRKQK